jgi:hypothetical protein
MKHYSSNAILACRQRAMSITWKRSPLLKIPIPKQKQIEPDATQDRASTRGAGNHAKDGPRAGFIRKSPFILLAMMRAAAVSATKPDITTKTICWKAFAND